MKQLSMTLTLVAAMLAVVEGHGRLMDPAGRSSMWRKGFQGVPIDFNDNQLFCGGFKTQTTNGGKCGVCGDPYTGPYDHQLGGKYYTDAIAGTYKPGQVLKAQVELTASHKGWFEFRVCASTDRTREVTQDCLNQNLLTLIDGSGTRYKVTKSGPAFHDVSLRLPAGLSCDYCVLQWRYHTGNSWGTDPDGTSCIGCGPQEEFYGCANIAITSTGTIGTRSTPRLPPAPTGAATPSPGGTPGPWTPPSTSSTWPSTADNCKAADGPYKDLPGMDKWCRTNCKVGNCPSTHCTCAATKRQVGELTSGAAKRQVTELTSGVKRAEVYQILRELLKKAVAEDDV